MSNTIDQYSPIVPLIVPQTQPVDLERVTAQTIETKIGEAIARLQNAVSDSYDNICVFSIYWESDDTQAGAADSSLSIHTLSQLRVRNIQLETYQQSIPARWDSYFRFGSEVVNRARSLSGSRKLFILHYAGHAIAGSSTSDSLIITPKFGQKRDYDYNEPQFDVHDFKIDLKSICSQSPGMDVLLVMDCYYCAVSGISKNVSGARVEFMAATASMDVRVSNPRQDGRRTFTQHWSEAFTKLLEIGRPFTCDDIIKNISSGNLFLLHEGWDLPITFCGSTTSTLPASMTSQMVIAVFHVEEKPDSLPMKQLINYLDMAPVPITVLVVLPFSESSTLLLLRIPTALQELFDFTLPQIFLG